MEKNLLKETRKDAAADLSMDRVRPFIPSAPIMARLADFILSNREPILADWEAFARTLGPASAGMNIAALRDHASAMLTVIAADLSTPQGKHEQVEKSKGNAPSEEMEHATAAEEHGADRADSGFAASQMISEYRALRASVIRLWTKAQGELKAEDIPDLTRFNEAIDQSLAESITRYTADLDHSKEMFIAMLGHDLRTPLGSITMSAQFLLETQNPPEPSLKVIATIERSSLRMNDMVGELLDFTRSRLGDGIPIVRSEVSMKHLIDDVVNEIRAAHPLRTVEIKADAGLEGEWDSGRMSQVLINLITNALEHGSDGMPVGVEARGDDSSVTLSIHNHGPAIPTKDQKSIFEPMKPSAPGAAASYGPTGNLGLGLYIAERIVSAHQGTIKVNSSEADGTTFTVILPRREPAPTSADPPTE